MKFHQIIFPIDGYRISNFLNSLDEITDSIIYISKPFDNTEYLAVGNLFNLDLGEKKLSILDEFILNFKNNIKIEQEDEELQLFFGYSKFPSVNKERLWKSFKNSLWIIPQYLIFSKGCNLYCAYNFLTSSTLNVSKIKESKQFILDIIRKSNQFNKKSILKKLSEEDYIIWEQKLAEAIKDIREDKLQKIVLARKVDFKISGSIDWFDVFEKLNSDYFDCCNFLIKSDTDYFFGSSPELLGKFEKDIFMTEALAGSINRGSNEFEDSELALLLSESQKIKKEHYIVINHLKENLQNHLFEIKIDETPLIKRLKNIQHLQTKISGRLKNNLKYFHLIESIFPTAAICGIPISKSLEKLITLEGFDRGLYSGIVGMFNLSGKAEFYVAIRSALLSNNILNTFAGCGVVEESNPYEEFIETELKLKPIISLFDNEN